MDMYATIRPLLFALPADTSHAIARTMLSWPAPWKLLRPGTGAAEVRLKTRYAGLALDNPVGLAAGLDKDGDLLPALATFGFGFVTIGSVMAEPRRGNPFPRVVRYPDQHSLADSMGLPSRGLGYTLERLKAFQPRSTPVVANVAGADAGEIARILQAVSAWVDQIEISLICPNIVRPEEFDPVALLRETMEHTGDVPVPVTVRVPNDVAVSHEQLAALLEACVTHAVSGVKIGGGRPVAEPRLGSGRGTLHGGAIAGQALENVRRAAQLARGRLDIKGNGGIITGADAAAMLRAGACCVDVYSAFVYRGWNTAALITSELLAIMDREGLSSLSDFHSRAAGTPVRAGA